MKRLNHMMIMLHWLELFFLLVTLSQICLSLVIQSDTGEM